MAHICLIDIFLKFNFKHLKYSKHVFVNQGSGFECTTVLSFNKGFLTIWSSIIFCLISEFSKILATEKMFLSNFRDLLYSTDIEVSYFAAGIAAHLSSYSLEPWTVKTITKEQLIQDLVTLLLWENLIKRYSFCL